MKRERINKIMEELLPELLKEFKGPWRINSGRYSKNLWSREDFPTRFEIELERELNKIEENYPLIERLVNAYNKALLPE